MLGDKYRLPRRLESLGDAAFLLLIIHAIIAIAFFFLQKYEKDSQFILPWSSMFYLRVDVFLYDRIQCGATI